MATLYFKVESDLQKVKDLRAEISRLEAQMKSFGRNTSAEDIKHTEDRLTSAKSKFTELANEAAKAGAVMESGFKKKVYEASQVINGYTEKIIEQKSVIKGVEGDVRKLSEAYGKAVKNKSPKANSILQELNASKAALQEEKAALFGLTQEQAKARLSVKKLRDEYAAFKGSSEGMTDTMDGISTQIKKWGAGLLAGYGIKEFASQVIRVRGEFQQMETSIKTLVGDTKANELIPQIKEMAKVSPLTMSDIVGAEQMMLGFNIAADDTVKYLRALSDVSMGNSQKFNSLTLAFSQMSAAGKLMGQDLNQMINAGFNPLQQISQTTGKSIAQLKKEMSAGAISAEMVQRAFIDATSAGGKFYKMSEEGSKTINGQISMMEDAMDNALNEIGKSSEGLIMTGIKGVTTLIENYETVGVVIAGLVTAYGLYKAALIANIALEKAANFQRLASIKGMTAQAFAVDVLTKKLQGLAIAKALTNPYIAAGVAITGATIAAVSFFKSMDGGKTSVGKVNAEYAELNKNIQNQKDAILNNISIIQDENQSNIKRAEAYEELKMQMPQLTGKYTQEQIAKMGLTEATKAYNKEVENELILLNKRQIRESQQRIQKLKTERAQFASAGNKNAVKLRDDQIKEEKAVLDQLLAIQEKYRKANQSGQEKDEVKNKEYWEKVKKEAESAKDALDVSLKGSKEWVELEKKAAAAQKEIDKYSSKADKDGNKDLAKKQESLAKIKEYNQNAQQALKDASSELKQVELQLSDDYINSEIKQIDLAYQAKIDENKKRSQEFIKQRAEQLALEWELANPEKAKKGEKFDKSKVTEDDLTEQQKETLKIYGQIAAKEKELSMKNKNDADFQAMVDYLKEYGTFQEKKYAIAKEYDAKIAKAQSQWEKQTLQAEKTTAVGRVDTESLKADIDWVTVFDGFGGMFADIVLPVLDKAKEYMQTDEFKKLELSDQSALIDAVSKLEMDYGKGKDVGFNDLGKAITEYQGAEAALAFAKEEERLAIEALVKATEDYENALKSGTDAEKDAARTAKETAQENKDTASAIVVSNQQAAKSAQQNVSDTARQLSNKVENITQGLQKIASGGLSNVYEGLIQSGKGMKGAIGKVSEQLENVPVVGWILQIIDLFKDGIGPVISGILDSIFSAISNILEDILSGKLFETIGTSLVKGIGSIFNALSFGALESLGGSSDKGLEKAIERLTESNDVLKNALDNLKDSLSEASVSGSKEVYDNQIELIKAMEKNTQEMMSRSVMAWDKGFWGTGIGGSHSSNYWINENLGKGEWAKVSAIVGKSIVDAEGFFNLTSEQMAKVAREAPEIYANIKAYANDGYKDAAQYMDEYISYYEQLDELQDKYYEKLTSISYSSVEDNFKSMLMDMEADAEDAADDISKTLMEGLISGLISDKYRTKLKKWYEDYAKMMEDDGTLSENEVDKLKKDYTDMINDAIAERNSLASVVGYDNLSPTTEQKAIYGGFESMSEDTGNELNGRFTALQLAGEEIKAQSIAQSISLTEIKGSLSSIFPMIQEKKFIIDEIRSLLATSLLELQAINENTSGNVKELKRLGVMFNKWDSKIMNL